jgi:O-antigen/teichoic acid export membrane protein
MFQILKNIFLLSASQFSNICIGLFTVVYYTNTFTVKEFGYFAIAGSIMAFSEVMKDIGVAIPILRDTNMANKKKSLLFFISVLNAILIVLILEVILYFTKSNDIIEELVQLGIINILISSALVVYRNLNLRYNHVKMLATTDIIFNIFQFAVTYLFITLDFSINSLLIGGIITAITKLLVYYISLKWRPSLAYFDFKEMIKIIRESIGYLYLFNLVNYFYRNLDILLIGKKLGLNELGIYNRIQRLNQLPIQTLRNPINSILFRENSENSKVSQETTLKLNITLNTVSVVIIAGLSALNIEWLVRLLLKPQWYEIFNIYSSVAILTFLQPILSFIGFLLLTINENKKYFIYGVINSVIHATFFITAFAFNIDDLQGFIYIFIAATTTSILALIYYLNRNNIKINSLITPVLKYIIIGIILLQILINTETDINPIIESLLKSAIYLIPFVFFGRNLFKNEN